MAKLRERMMNRMTIATITQMRQRRDLGGPTSITSLSDKGKGLLMPRSIRCIDQALNHNHGRISSVDVKGLFWSSLIDLRELDLEFLPR